MSDTDGDERQWMLLPLDEKIARRQGMPLKVPVPKEHFEGLADEGLSGEKLTAWIKDFLANAPVAKDGNWRRRNSEIVGQLEGFIDKQPLWEKAQKLFEQNEFDKALKTLRRITVMCPDDHAAMMNYASALANRGEYDKAMKALKRVRDSFEGEADYHVTVAQVEVARGNSEAAIEQLVVALEHEPAHLAAMDALSKLGVLTSVYEDPRDASTLTYVRADSVLEYLQQVWDGEPRAAEYYLEQLGYHQSERRYEVALAAAERAIAVAAEQPLERAEIGRVAALRGLGRGADALAAAERFAAACPKSAAAQAEWGMCLDQLGRAADAEAAFDAALRLDPGDQQALAEKLWPDDREDLMAVSEAIAGLEQYASAHAEVAGAWRSLARALLIAQRDDEALSLFAKAVVLAPDDEDLRSEWWGELAAKQRFTQILDDSQRLGEMATRDWRLRWNEAEAYRGLGRLMEARACYLQINMDDTLHVDIRKRAKRTSMELGGPPSAGEATTGTAAGDEG